MPGCIIRPARCAPITVCAGGGCSTTSAPRTACRIANAASSSSPPTRARPRGSKRSLQAGADQWRGRGRDHRRRGGSAGSSPRSSACGAMRSPETGIVDSHRYMLALRGDLEDHGGVIAFNTRSSASVKAAGGWEAYFGGADPQSIRSMRWSMRRASARRRSARATEGYPPERVPRLCPRQGQLFRLCRPAGVLAADLSGADSRRARRARDARSGGPHALRAGRRVDRARRTTTSMPARAAAFYARIRDYWPGLPGQRSGAGLCRHPAEADRDRARPRRIS